MFLTDAPLVVVDVFPSARDQEVIFLVGATALYQFMLLLLLLLYLLPWLPLFHSFPVPTNSSASTC